MAWQVGNLQKLKLVSTTKPDVLGVPELLGPLFTKFFLFCIAFQSVSLCTASPKLAFGGRGGTYPAAVETSADGFWLSLSGQRSSGPTPVMMMMLLVVVVVPGYSATAEKEHFALFFFQLHFPSFLFFSPYSSFSRQPQHGHFSLWAP